MIASALVIAMVSLLAAASGAITSGYAMNLAIPWYNISPREGASGYAIIAMAIIGVVGGLLIGLIVGIVFSGQFLAAFFVSQGIVLSLVLLIGGTARLLADVPPTLNGKRLLLEVEIRWPLEQRALPEEGSEKWKLMLRSVRKGRVRMTGGDRPTLIQSSGPFIREAARLEENQWVVPGNVEVFTSRGQRVLDIEPTGTIPHGFLIPLPAFPSKVNLEWSVWLPRARKGQARLPEGVTCRFRVCSVENHS